MSVEPSEFDLLAAELAFGLLDGPEAADAEARARVEPDFAAALARWREHLAELIDREAAAETGPNQSLWRRIAGEIGIESRGEVVVLRRALGRWRAAAFGFGAIAAALVAALLVRPQPVHETVVERPQLVALLGPGSARPLGAASYDGGTGRLTLHLRHLRGGGRVPELWVIGADGKPRSLGVVLTPEAWSAVAPASTLPPGATLAVSLEPAGGSPTGQPTGPVILSGALS